MFLWYKYLIVSLVFSHLGFWSGNLSLIAPFPDLCLLVPFCREYKLDWTQGEFKILGVTFSVEVFDIWDLNTGQVLILKHSVKYGPKGS